MSKFLRVLALIPLLLPTKALALTETECLAYTMFKEAGGEPVRGRRAVLDVIYNRMRVKGMSACAVMKEKAQFSFYNSKKKIVITMEALMDFLIVDNMKPILPSNALYFHTRDIKPAWSYKLRKVATINNHIFYVEELKNV